MRPVNFLALCGSLRAASTNAALLRAAQRLAPPGVEVRVADSLGALPLFNPDLEASDPAPVARLYRQIVDADAVIIASPEYAHGVTGVMKNALDWMVGNDSFVNKTVAIFNASPRTIHAPAALREIVTTMSARVVEEASICVPLLGAGFDEAVIAAHAEIAPMVVNALRILQHEVEHARPVFAVAGKELR